MDPRPFLRVLGHDMHLQSLLVVVKPERLEVRRPEPSPLRLEANGHCRTEHRQTLVQPNDLLLVQPQKRTVHEFGVIPDLTPQDQIGRDRVQELSQRRLGKQVRAPCSARKGGEQVVQQSLGRRSALRRGFDQRTPTRAATLPAGLPAPVPAPRGCLHLLPLPGRRRRGCGLCAAAARAERGCGRRP